MARLPNPSARDDVRHSAPSWNAQTPFQISRSASMGAKSSGLAATHFQYEFVTMMVIDVISLLLTDGVTRAGHGLNLRIIISLSNEQACTGRVPRIPDSLGLARP